MRWSQRNLSLGLQGTLENKGCSQPVPLGDLGKSQESCADCKRGGRKKELVIAQSVGFEPTLPEGI